MFSLYCDHVVFFFDTHFLFFWRGVGGGGYTVDGRNPAPPNMYETLQIMRYLPYQLVSRISSINSMSLFLQLFKV